jgi:hypothetical protein
MLSAHVAEQAAAAAHTCALRGSCTGRMAATGKQRTACISMRGRGSHYGLGNALEKHSTKVFPRKQGAVVLHIPYVY